jgi:hypothetical protein
MAFPKKGARRIVVEGETYRWKVSRMTHPLWYASPGCMVIVQHEIHPGSVLEIDWPSYQPEDPILPSYVAEWIQIGQSLGWQATEPGGGLFRIKVNARPNTSHGDGEIAGFESVRVE